MSPEEKQRFIASLDRAAKIVATWPKWKQNILVDSSKPQVAPRKPVQ